MARFSYHPPYGIRFSLGDGVAILICAAATIALRPMIGSFVWLFPVALGHFFLFCNVFRIHRKPELIWTAIFIINFAWWNHLGEEELNWLALLAVQSILTIALIIREMRLPRYHGIGTQWINPGFALHIEAQTNASESNPEG